MNGLKSFLAENFEEKITEFLTTSQRGIPILTRILQKNIWGSLDFRRHFEKNGVHLQPANFYSQFPTLEDIEGSFEYQMPFPFGDSTVFGRDLLREKLQSLKSYVTDFQVQENPDPMKDEVYFSNNSEFSHSDALAYHALISMHKPRRIVEIGSGFSSMISFKALKKSQGKLLCIEPYPRPFLNKVCDELIQKKIQDVSKTEFLDLFEDGDFLFIDSTHTVKAGSDCLWIYLVLLPELIKSGKKIFVHAHDIFLPFGMPKNFLVESRLAWTEQYLLYAFLLFNPKCRVIFSSPYSAKFLEKELHELHQNFPSLQKGGSSIWFTVNQDPSSTN